MKKSINKIFLILMLSIITALLFNSVTVQARHDLDSILAHKHRTISTMADTLVWPQARVLCPTIASGQFHNQLISDGGMAGSHWRICEDGTLEIEPGFMNSNWGPPWLSYTSHITTVDILGDVTAGRSLFALFFHLANLEAINGLEYLDTSQTVDMRMLFAHTHQITELNLSHFDTANVRDMSNMFSNTLSLENLDLSNFDTTNVRTMHNMFRRTGLVELDLSHFDTSNLVEMPNMFTDSSKLTYLNLSSFDTSALDDWDVWFSYDSPIALSFIPEDVEIPEDILELMQELESPFLSHSNNLSRSTDWSMYNAFTGTNSLNELVLGENFEFRANAGLPEIQPTEDFTGLWQNVGAGIAQRPAGLHIFTSDQLSANFDGATMADTFIWQPVISICPTIATGRFPNQPLNEDGLHGAEWRICEDGTLEIEAGFIYDRGWQSGWHLYSEQVTRIEILGNLLAGEAMIGAFSNFPYLTEINGLERLDTSKTRFMGHMFAHNHRLEALNVSNFNTSNVVGMEVMFSSLYALELLNLSNFDTRNVTHMQLMFGNTPNLRFLDISNFNTQNVMNMAAMFMNTGLEELDLSHFDTLRIGTMSQMFQHSSALRYLNLSSFDVVNPRRQSVISAFMHPNAFGIQGLELGIVLPSNIVAYIETFENLLEYESVSRSSMNPIMSMFHAFQGTESLSELVLGTNFAFGPIADLPAIQASEGFTGLWQNVGDGTIQNPRGENIFTSQQLMNNFNGATMADTFVWQPARVLCPTIASGQLPNQPLLEGGLQGAEWRICEDGTLEIESGFINIAGWNAGWQRYQNNVIQIEILGDLTAGRSLIGAFSSLPYLEAINGLDMLDTSRTEFMTAMFGFNPRLRELDLSGLDLSRGENMDIMFAGLYSLESINLTNINTARLGTTAHMFANNRSLTTLDLSSFDTSNVIDMRGMFSNTPNLHYLDISNFNTQNVRDMSAMFADTGLEMLDLSHFDTSRLDIMAQMFINSSSLRYLNLYNFNTTVSHPSMNTFSTTYQFGIQGLDYGTVIPDTVVEFFENQQNMFENQTTNISPLIDTYEEWIDLWFMNQAFLGTYSLSELVLGEEFEFRSNAGLPEIQVTEEFTGLWQNVGDYGTSYAPEGINELSSLDLMLQFYGPEMADTYVWQPYIEELIIEDYIAALSIDEFIGIIDQYARTITFTAPLAMQAHGQLNGNITALDASTDIVTVFTPAWSNTPSGGFWQLGLGDSLGVRTDDTIQVYFGDGLRGEVYTIIVNWYEPTLEGIIQSISIGDVVGIIDQTAQTITFNITSNQFSNNQFRGDITELTADASRVHFFIQSANRSWELGLGENAGISTGDQIFVTDGVVYTVIIQIDSSARMIDSISLDGVVGDINQSNRTITFRIAPHQSVNGQFRGAITELTADANTVNFFIRSANRSWELGFGDVAGISTNDEIFVTNGIVYRVIIEIIQ